MVPDRVLAGSDAVDALATGTFSTPAGQLSVAVDADGFLRAAVFGTDLSRLGVDLLPAGPGDLPGGIDEAITRYSEGALDALDPVRVAQPGGLFQQTVWSAIRRIPAGETVSYAQLAALAGVPTAVRAVAGACARNLVALFVPCHRVVRADGALGGYAYGSDRKRLLLEHENAAVARSQRP